MENASKALIMAAGVLIGISVLSLAVYLFASFGTTAAETNKQIEQNQLNQFNSQFTSYKGKTDLTIHDIITVANLAKEINKNNGVTDSNNPLYIDVKLGNSSILSENDNELITSITSDISRINEDNLNLPRYECLEVSINSTTRKVNKVIFKKNS